MIGEVYLARISADQVKIGHSKNKDQRLAALATKHGMAEFLISFPGSTEDERRLHSAMKPFLDRATGGREIFRIPETVLADLIASLHKEHGDAVSTECAIIHSVDLRLPDDLRKRLRILAAIRNTSLHQLILDMLKASVDDAMPTSDGDLGEMAKVFA